MLVGVLALLILTRLVLRPLDNLIAATRRIAGGDYAQRAEIRSVSDLERVAGSFNEMAGAIESDVGARERAEQEAVAARQAAEHANRAKSTFLAAMSHELRTPMIGVTGMLEVLAQSDLSPAQRQMVATADSSALSLLQIIGDILDLSKIEASKLELSPATIDLRAVVGACAETFVHTASAKGLLLAWNVDERLAPALVCDPLRLRQVLNNFLSNAVKFTEVGGIEVDVRVLSTTPATRRRSRSPSATRASASTTSSSARLFEEFAQAESTTSRRFGGTGLGLVISKRLAVLMGGDVALESAAGEGHDAAPDAVARARRPGGRRGDDDHERRRRADEPPAADARGGAARGQPAAARRGPPGQPHRARVAARDDRLSRRHRARRPGRLRAPGAAATTRSC